MKARKRTVCTLCGKAINPQANIDRRGSHWVHRRCDEKAHRAWIDKVRRSRAS